MGTTLKPCIIRCLANPHVSFIRPKRDMADCSIVKEIHRRNLQRQNTACTKRNSVGFRKQTVESSVFTYRAGRLISPRSTSPENDTRRRQCAYRRHLAGGCWYAGQPACRPPPAIDSPTPLLSVTFAASLQTPFTSHPDVWRKLSYNHLASTTLFHRSAVDFEIVPVLKDVCRCLCFYATKARVPLPVVAVVAASCGTCSVFSAAYS